MVSSLKATPVPVVELADGVSHTRQKFVVSESAEFITRECKGVANQSSSAIFCSEKANPRVPELLLSVSGQRRPRPLRSHLGPEDQETAPFAQGVSSQRKRIQWIQSSELLMSALWEMYTCF